MLVFVNTDKYLTNKNNLISNNSSNTNQQNLRTVVLQRKLNLYGKLS